jgi:hypothetical protein
VRYIVLYPLIRSICSNIPAAPASWIYIIQLIRYSRACGYYQEFLHRGLVGANKENTETISNILYALKISSFCSTSETFRVTLATNSVISHEWGKALFPHPATIDNKVKGDLSIFGKGSHLCCSVKQLNIL